MNKSNLLKLCGLLIFIFTAFASSRGYSLEEISILTPSEAPSITGAEPKRAIDDPNFTIFVKAIKAGDISDIFNGTGPFTAFIPSNAAFEKLGKNKVDELFKPENKDKLVDVLIYHIVPGKYLSENLKTRSYRTINGKTLEIKVVDGKVFVNNAQIVRSDLKGPNGVIHEIDTVLIP